MHALLDSFWLKILASETAETQKYSMSLLETVLVKMDLSEEPTEFAHQDAHPDRSGTEPTVSAKKVGLDTELVDNAPSEHSLTHSEHVASALIPTKSSYPTDLFASHAALILNLQLI